MDVRVLGPVEVSVKGRAVAVGAGKPRALLALLALRAGETVTVERLVDGLWGEPPPPTATKLVQFHVYQLRKAFGASGADVALLTRGHGYQLRLQPDELDSERFKQLVARGRPREALALWRGPALDDVAGEPFAAAEIRRLEEQRWMAVELALDQDLDAGRHREAVEELEALVLEQPLRERLHEQRMIALYRCSRQADALAAYRQARTALVEQIGVEPGPELRRLHEAILRQDPSLERPGTAMPAIARDTDLDGDIARRLGGTASRITAGRRGLRTAEDDLVADIVELQAARERVELENRAGGAPVVCPFKGLACFEPEDAEFFCGRERLVAELVARLTGAPLTGIVGASGSGKSSLLRAGVLPALSSGVLPGSASWTQILLRPGARPALALQQAIAETPRTGRLVLAVDQFEEAFAACPDDDERAAFIAALVASARDPRRRALVLVAIRADFYGRCGAYPELARLLGASHVLVGMMRRDELRRAIELPARRAGLHIEPDLVDALIADADREPGALPLLSSSLLELWQHREGRTLRLSDYERAGGVRGAVARLAEHAYERLDPPGRLLAMRILLHLAGDGEGDSIVRRRVPLAAFEGDDLATVLRVLADARLLTISEGEVEVAHEALLREWPRLRAWLADDSEARRLRQHLAHAARGWQARGHDPAELYRGARLESAVDWLDRHEDEPDGLERAFLAESQLEAERASERRRRANRRLRALSAGLAALLAVALAAGILAVSQRAQARDAAVAADAQRVGAEALGNELFDEELLLTRAGVALHDSAATRGNLLSALLQTRAAIGVLHGDGSGLIDVATSPDGRLAAVLTGHRNVKVFDVASRRLLGPPYRFGHWALGRLTFSPDGRTLAIEGDAIELIDPRTRRFRVQMTPGGFGPTSIVFLPDGRDAVVEQTDPDDPGYPAPVSVLRRYELNTGVAHGRSLTIPRPSSGVSATANRRTLFMTSRRDRETYSIDAETLRVLRRWPVGDATGTVSPDGRWFALGSPRGEVRVLDLRTGGTRRFAGGVGAAVARLQFTPDGRTLVSSHDDGRIRVWDVALGRLRELLSGHGQGGIRGLDISADGRTLYSAGDDERALIWDLAGDRRLLRPFDAGPPLIAAGLGYDSQRGIAVSPDGQTLAVPQTDGTVDLLDAVTLRRRGRVRALDGFADAAAFSRDGNLLAITGARGQITLWNPRSLRREGELTGLSTTSQALAFSPDGKLLAAAQLGHSADGAPSEDGTVGIWDVHRRARIPVHFQVTSTALAFSPNGNLLAAAGNQRPTEIRNPHNGRLVARLRTPDWGRSVAFSPDGRLIATGHIDGTAQLWSARTWKPVGPPFEGHAAQPLLSMQFAADGHVLATSGADGTVQLWDVATRSRIGTPVTVDPGAAVTAALTPDGSQLFAVSTSRRGVRLNLSPKAWKRHACQVAGRDLTPREWHEALPSQRYRPVCTAR